MLLRHRWFDVYSPGFAVDDLHHGVLGEPEVAADEAVREAFAMHSKHALGLLVVVAGTLPLPASEHEAPEIPMFWPARMCIRYSKIIALARRA